MSNQQVYTVDKDFIGTSDTSVIPASCVTVEKKAQEYHVFVNLNAIPVDVCPVTMVTVNEPDLIIWFRFENKDLVEPDKKDKYRNIFRRLTFPEDVGVYHSKAWKMDNVVHIEAPILTPPVTKQYHEEIVVDVIDITETPNYLSTLATLLPADALDDENDDDEDDDDEFLGDYREVFEALRRYNNRGNEEPYPDEDMPMDNNIDLGGRSTLTR